MYSFSYLEPVCCSMSSSNCCFLTCIQISQKAGQVVWYSHLFQNFTVFCDPHKALPKAKLEPKRGHGHYSFLNPSKTIISEKYTQSINEIHWKLQHLQLGTDQQQGPYSSPQQRLPTFHTTNASKVEQTGLWSFASSATFTWPLPNQLPLLQASQQLFAGKMLPQLAGCRKCFPRVRWILKHRFLCYRNKQTYFSSAKLS